MFCDYFSELSSGGSERVAREVVTRLANWGARVTVITASARAVAVPAGVEVVRVPALDVSRLVGGQVAVAPALSRRAAKVVEDLRPHVIHAHSLHFQGTLVAARLAQRLAIPLVTTVHVGRVEGLGRSAVAAAGGYERSVGRYILRRSRWVIAVSEPIAAHVRSLAGDRCPVRVVPNGVDTDVFVPQPESGRRRVPRILFVGRLIANKGPQVLMDALDRLHRRGIAFEAEFVGDGPLMGDLRRRARPLEAVTFSGYQADVARRLQRADVVVRPSFSEGLPLGVLEAMATGVCVVASDVPGNAVLVEHDVSGLLFPTGSSNALAALLEEILGDRARRDRLGAAGRAIALRHSWDTAAMETGRLLAAAGGCR